MTAGGPVVAIILPLVLAAAMVARTFRPLVTRLAPWAALPAFVLSNVHAAQPVLEVRSALLGARFGATDALARGFFAFTALLWFFAGSFARSYIGGSAHRNSFWFFFLTTMGGNMGVVLARDVATFYVCYAVMTFAAYGLVVHERDDGARRAARTYIAMAIGGEMLVLPGFLLVVTDRIDLPLRDVRDAIANGPHRDLICGLLFAGFGVKAGLVPLHLWLPLAHPVAPTPASAVLSGTIIEAGLLGWLRFLPLGAVALPAAGLFCAAMGFATALYGSAVGITQEEPKTVLAYSSVSQMGFAIAALGIGLADPIAAEPAKAAILFFALHHAVAKGSLFLGTAVAKATTAGRSGRLVLLGLFLPALAIAGAPLTSGALAKSAIKDVMKLAPIGSSVFVALLSVAAIGSTLLMARFLIVSVPLREATHRAPRPGLWVPWALLILGGAMLVLHPSFQPKPLAVLIRPDALWSAAWPVLAGTGIAFAASYLLRRLGRPAPTIPPGDLLVLFESAMRRAHRGLAETRKRARRKRRSLQVSAHRRLQIRRRLPLVLESFERVDERLAGFGTIGVLVLLLLAVLLPLVLR